MLCMVMVAVTVDEEPTLRFLQLHEIFKISRVGTVLSLIVLVMHSCLVKSDSWVEAVEGAKNANYTVVEVSILAAPAVVFI